MAEGMPPVRSATAASRSRTRTSSRPGAGAGAPRRLSGPRRLVRRAPRGRVRWDRVGRVALLVVFAVVAGLYLQQGLAYLSARSQYNHQHAIVTGLQRDNARLSAEARLLQDPATIVRFARQLGMVRPGERSYAISGLPGR